MCLFSNDQFAAAHSPSILADLEEISPDRPVAAVYLETYTVEDTSPEHEVGITYPDMALLSRRGVEEPAVAYGVAVSSNLTESDYLFTLWRVGTRRVAVRTNQIMQPLLLLPVLLKEPDPDVPMPLRQVLDLAYRQGCFICLLIIRQTCRCQGLRKK